MAKKTAAVVLGTILVTFVIIANWVLRGDGARQLIALGLVQVPLGSPLVLKGFVVVFPMFFVVWLVAAVVMDVPVPATR